MEGVLLAVEMLKRIPRRSKITASELQVQLADIGFERDLRSIQRQLDTLCQHFDIERDDRSKPYGYSWKGLSTGLSLPTLNEKESMLLTLAEQHLRNLLPASLLHSMEGFFKQAKIKLGPLTEGKPEREWLKKVRVVGTTQPLLPPKIKDGVFDTVSNALYYNHWLSVDYVNARSERKTYRVMPLGLAQQGPRLFLVSRFEGYSNERSLAMHRIQKAEDTGMTFKRPPEFNLQRFDDDGRFGFGEGNRIKIKFRITKDSGFHLLETPLSPDQSVTELGDEYEISATVIDSGQLKCWLRGFGAEVKVLSPENLI